MKIGQKIAEVCGYLNYREFDNGRDAAIVPMLYTHALVADLDNFGYGDRWCYKTFEGAQNALAEWSGDGEPNGWHRHPDTGRRRENGDPEKETIQP